MTMTPERLQEINARHSGTTPGPWNAKQPFDINDEIEIKRLEKYLGKQHLHTSLHSLGALKKRAERAEAERDALLNALSGFGCPDEFFDDNNLAICGKYYERGIALGCPVDHAVCWRAWAAAQARKEPAS